MDREPEVDVLVIGAGITGIYQLYRAREAGFSALLLEAGAGVGGTWFWNRYPGAQFDSESYTYAYLFSEELFDEWEWQEHFAHQPEIERYLNHVVDRFDLRRDVRLNSRVTSAVFDESAEKWTVSIGALDADYRARFLIATTGVLSVPYIPDVPGREDYSGEQYHTGQWPASPVEFAGKRVAVVGTGSSGVQIVPVIADEVASLTVFQRSANWCTPLNNRPITPAEQQQLRADFETLRQTVNTSIHGFHHPPHDRASSDDSPEERRVFFERMWNSPGFTKMTSNYTDLLLDRDANAAWCDFLAGKIRSIVDDPETAEKLIPKERFGDKRPPYVTGYYESFNLPNVSLVDLEETPIIRMTVDGIETSDHYAREFDIVVWATGFDFGTGALARMGIRGRNGVALEDYWADGPRTFLGVQCAGFPNLFFPGGPHAAAGNNPRYNSDQVDFVTDTLVFLRERGYDTIEVDDGAEESWTNMVNAGGAKAVFGGQSSYFFGANIPGKPRRYLLNAGGRPALFATIRDVVDSDYKAFRLSRSG